MVWVKRGLFGDATGPFRIPEDDWPLNIESASSKPGWALWLDTRRMPAEDILLDISLEGMMPWHVGGQKLRVLKMGRSATRSSNAR